MFESGASAGGPLGAAQVGAATADASSSGLTPTLDPATDDLAQVRALRARLADAPREMSDEQRVDVIRACEELKNAACAAQARWSVDLDASQRAVQAAAGVPARLQGQGVAGQVALARRESAHRGARHLGLAKVLVAEMPKTRSGLAEGWLSEWRARCWPERLPVCPRSIADRWMLSCWAAAGRPPAPPATPGRGDR
ncbi:MAG TPA: hypothetical protein VFJ09_01295 [Nocardioidaceae bacterium]|nr:hypothetical protein [Nocardioidaceae bacterium]